MDALWQDLKYALRSLSREPQFALFVIATLALGIGANAAMFGIVDRLLIRGPEHVRDPGRVARIYRTHGPERQDMEFQRTWEGTTDVHDYIEYHHLRAGTHAFTDPAAY